jgi:uncharacterized membrane protein YfcA
MQETFVLAMAALLAGLSKGGLGGPVPIALTTPLLALVMPVKEAVGLILPVLIFADTFALYAYWQKWDMRYVRLLLPAAIVGILVGTLLLSNLSDDILRRILGGFTLVVIAYKVASDNFKSMAYTPRNWHGWFAGWASGFGSAIANTGSPPFTAYMLLQPSVTPVKFMGTTTLFFAIVNILKMPGYIQEDIIQVDRVISVSWTLAIIPVGVWLGYKSILWINPKAFERLMLVALFLLSFFLLVG